MPDNIIYSPYPHTPFPQKTEKTGAEQKARFEETWSSPAGDL
jgi:hypothetical protein